MSCAFNTLLGRRKPHWILKHWHLSLHVTRGSNEPRRRKFPLDFFYYSNSSPVVHRGAENVRRGPIRHSHIAYYDAHAAAMPNLVSAALRWCSSWVGQPRTGGSQARGGRSLRPLPPLILISLWPRVQPSRGLFLFLRRTRRTFVA